MNVPFSRYALGDLAAYVVLFSLTIAACVWLAVTISGLFWLPVGVFAVLLGFTINFFRDPARPPPPESVGSDARVFVSPAEGTVWDIADLDAGEAGNPLHVPAVRVGIFLSIFDVHVNRSPCEAVVEGSLYTPGAFHDARSAAAAARNERLCLWLQSSAMGGTIAVIAISGAVARRIICPAKAGDSLATGERFGMIKFGSRTELIVPQSNVEEVLASVGTHVRVGQSPLIRIRRNPSGEG